jgi:ABC-type polysaccharide/polyol phosphate export permease
VVVEFHELATGGRASVVIEGRPPAARRVMALTATTWILSRRNFQVRYKRAALGVLWAVLQPALQSAVLAYVFIHVFSADRGVPHYPVYVLSGMLPWTFFTQSLSSGTTSVVDNASLVRKVAIPQLIYPLSSIGGTAIAFAFASPILLVAGGVVHSLGWHLLLLPFALALELFLIVGVTALTAALHPAYRDVRYIVDSVLTVGLYATPVVYTLAKAGHTLRILLRWNPLTGPLELYRAAILSTAVDWSEVTRSLAIGVLMLGCGLAVFRARRDEFADLV